jgi:hypothetical protein
MTISIDQMIDKIEMYVSKRQIGIAEVLAADFLNDCSSSPLKESGYAILSIALAYFEMVEQFIRGQDSKNQSKAFFVEGFKKVYPATSLTDTDIKQIYEWVRCGMYHGGMTRNQTPLSRFFACGFAIQNGEIQINPGKVVEEIKSHFAAYVAHLRNPAHVAKRQNFQSLCQQIGVDQTIPTTVTVTTTVGTPTMTSSTSTPTRTTPAPWEHG